MRKLLIGAMSLLMVSACGCRAMRFFTYALFGQETESIRAAFPDLPGQKVAVFVFADEQVQYEYPVARSRLTRRIAADLEAHVDDIQVVSPEVVLKFQSEHTDWVAMDRTKLAERFGADYVLLVSVIRYTTRAPRSVSLYRGHIEAEAAVYQASLPERRSRVWATRENLVETYPEQATTGLLRKEAARIRDETERRFVDKLVKLFYDHEQEIEL
jgi:hypothetical protein